MNEKEAKKFLEKIDNGEKLSESELRELCEDAFQDDVGEQHRWTQTITSYVDLKNGGRTFAVEWERALTEMQENGYYKQPYEVEEVEEIVRVHQWVKKDRKRRRGLI